MQAYEPVRSGHEDHLIRHLSFAPSGHAVDSTALPAGTRQDGSDRMLEAEMVIGDDQAHARKPADDQAA